MSKKNSQRPCPALQRLITSKECGSDRHSRIACTADCPFNPFTPQNYSELLELEKSADAKTRARLFKTMSPRQASMFASQLQSMNGDMMLIEEAYRFEFFHRPGPDGRDFITTWEAEGWTGLNNDERTYYQGHRKLAPSLLEAQGTVDDSQVTMAEVRHPGHPTFTAIDRTLAASTPRFTTFLAWHFPLPHYRRLFSVNITVGPLGPWSVEEVFDEIVRHLGGPSDPDQLTPWLALHFNDFARSFRATQDARLEDTRRLADRRTYRTSWQYAGPLDPLLQAFNASPDLESDALKPIETAGNNQAAYEIIAAPASLAEWTLNSGADIIGRLVIAPGTVSAFCEGQGNHDRLLVIVETAAGPLLQRGPTAVEAPPPLPPAAPPAPDLVPPRLLEKPTIREDRRLFMPEDNPDEAPSPESQRVANLLNSTFLRFVDIPATELKGLTLRAAAADPAHRPTVVQWMKRHINKIDILAKYKNPQIDINSQLADMALDELIYDPPARLYIGDAEQ